MPQDTADWYRAQTAPDDTVHCRACGRPFSSRRAQRIHEHHAHQSTQGTQTSIDDYIDAPAWTPAATPDGRKYQCENCGENVSAAYYRLWAVDGELPHCYNCKSRTQRYSNNPTINPSDDERDPFNTDTNL